MPRDVKTEHFFLTSQLLLRRPFLNRRIDLPARPLSIPGAQKRKNVGLIADAVLLVNLGLSHRIVQRRHDPRPRESGRIKSPALDEALDDTSVDRAEIDAPAKVIDRLEPRLAFARGEHNFDRLFADVFDRRKTKTNLIADRRKVGQALIDVGR